ncbi:MAG: Gfo/Idh/MocA family oxidoreductase [Ferruginibacter sp.]
MKPIKTALCSFGMSGWVFHAPFIQAHPGFELYAVLERTKTLAVQSYSQVITFRNLEELLADENIELVVVNVPNVLHYDYALQCLNAGKHVIVEKPFTITLAQASELIKLAEQNKLLLSVFQNRRWDSDFLTVQRIVKSGMLGEIKEVEIHYDRYNEAPSPKAHKEVPEKGTGIIYDLGSHLIDQALQLFGMPEAVFADTVIQRPVSLVDDYMEILLIYPGLRVRLKGSTLIKEAVPAFTVHGSKGSFLKVRGDVQEADLQQHKVPLSSGWGIEATEHKGLLHTEVNGEVLKQLEETEAGDYMLYYEAMFQALRHDKPLPVTASEGANVIQVIEAAYKSVRSRSIIDIKNSW